MALLFAIAAGLALGKRGTRLAWFAAASAVIVLAWSLYVRSAAAGGATTTYGQEFFFRDPYRPELGHVTLSDLLSRVVTNLKVYLLSAWPQTIGGRDVGRGIGTAFAVLLGGVVLGGVLRRVRKPGVPELFAGAYVGLILVWPQAWSDQRLLLPFVPLAAVYLVEAIAWGAGRRRGLAYAAAGICIAFAVMANLRAGPAVPYPAAFADFIEASKWIGDHTEPGAVVINRKPQILYWYGHRPGDLYPYTTDADSLMRFLDVRHARYVVVDNLYGTTGRYLVPAIRQYLSRFRPIHQVGNPPTYVLEYQGGAR